MSSTSASGARTDDPASGQASVATPTTSAARAEQGRALGKIPSRYPPAGPQPSTPGGPRSAISRGEPRGVGTVGFVPGLVEGGNTPEPVPGSVGPSAPGSVAPSASGARSAATAQSEVSGRSAGVGSATGPKIRSGPIRDEDSKEGEDEPGNDSASDSSSDSGSTETATPENDDSPNYVFHDRNTLNTVAKEDPLYFYKFPIVLVKNRAPFETDGFYRKSLAEELPIEVKDIIAFSSLAVMNILIEVIYDEAEIPKQITDLLFIKPETMGAQQLPAQELFFMFFAQMIFLANVRTPDAISIHNSNFEDQYEFIRKELETGSRSASKKFFGFSIQDFKSGYEDQTKGENELPHEQLSWWERKSVGSFVCVNIDAELDDLIDIFVLGPCAMLNFLHLEKKYFNTIGKDLREQIAELHAYAEANVVQLDKNDENIQAIKTTIKTLRTSPADPKIKPRFKTMEALKEEIVRRVEIDFDDLCSETESQGENSGDDGSDDGSEDGGSVPSSPRGKPQARYPHGPIQPPGQAGLFDKMNWGSRGRGAGGTGGTGPTTPGGRGAGGTGGTGPTTPGGRGAGGTGGTGSTTPGGLGTGGTGARPPSTVPGWRPPSAQPSGPILARRLRPGQNIGLPSLQNIQTAIENNTPVGARSQRYNLVGMYRVTGPIGGSDGGIHYRFTPTIGGPDIVVPESAILTGDIAITVPVAVPDAGSDVPGVPGAVPALPGVASAVPGEPGAGPAVPGALPAVPGAVPALPGVASAVPGAPGAGPRAMGAPPRIVIEPGPDGPRTIARPEPVADAAARVAGENMGMCGGGKRTRKNRKGPVIALNL